MLLLLRNLRPLAVSRPATRHLASKPLPCLRVLSVAQPCAYTAALAWQRSEHALLMKCQGQDSGGEGESDRLLLLEHSPVYTLGRRAKAENILFDPAGSNVEVHRVERGGEVTYHGPGQVVGYPIIDLTRHRKDLHWYLRQVEEVIIRVLRTYGLDGAREEEYTGVWVGNAKVAAIGLSASKWVTMHGFALNVDTDLRAFERIVPCGIDRRTGLRVSSIHAELRAQGWVSERLPSNEEVRERIVEEFIEVFNMELTTSGVEHLVNPPPAGADCGAA